MDWISVHKAWEKWVSSSVGSSGEPLRAALLINYDRGAPSRLLSTIAEQEGRVEVSPVELNEFISFIKRNRLQAETFIIGQNQYLATSIHENWLAARCLNSTKPSGEGAIVMQTPTLLLVALYEGATGSASRAMVAVDQLGWLLSRKHF